MYMCKGLSSGAGQMPPPSMPPVHDIAGGLTGRKASGLIGRGLAVSPTRASSWKVSDIEFGNWLKPWDPVHMYCMMYFLTNIGQFVNHYVRNRFLGQLLCRDT